MESIYILEHACYKPFSINKNVILCKIGSTKDIYSRMMTYKTGYPVFDNKSCSLKVFSITNSKYNCYQLDDFINYSSINYSYPFKHYNETGGTEFYEVINLNNLYELFNKLNIKYEMKIYDIDELMQLQKRVNYELIAKENNKKEKRYSKMNIAYIHAILSEIGIIQEITAKVIIPNKKQNETLYNAIIQYENKFNIKGIICGPPGCGKTIMAIMIINYIFSQLDGYILWSTKFQKVLDSQFTINNIISWKKSNILHKDITFITRKHVNEIGSIIPNKTVVLCCNATLKINNNLIKDNLIGMIYDECHNMGNKTYNKLLHISNIVKLLIGMSATPTITKETTIKIFGENEKKINFLLDYSFVDAISDDVILPLKFKYKFIDRKGDYEGTNTYKSVINPEKSYDFIKTLLMKSYNGKAILWTNTRDSADGWYDILTPLLKNDEFEVYKDHGNEKQSDESFDNFYNDQGRSVMFAVFKYREGADIQNVSVCGFLDPVHERSIITLLQSMGRASRKYEEKKYGIYFEFLFRDDEESLNNRISEFYYSITQNLDYDVDISGLNIKNSGNKLLIKRDEKKIGSIEITNDCGKYDYSELTAKMLSFIINKMKGTPTWKEIKELLAVNKIKDKGLAREFLETKANDAIKEWWQIIQYHYIDWNDLLSYDISKYYDKVTCIEIIRNIVNDLYKKLTFDDIKELTELDVYKKYILICDDKLPVNLTNYCHVDNINDIFSIDYESFT